VNAAPSRAVQNPLFDVTKRLVRDAEDSSQIIAFTLIFLWRNDFRCILWRINKTGGTLEVLSIWLFGGRVGLV
jgi:hypothetical protein